MGSFPDSPLRDSPLTYTITRDFLLHKAPKELIEIAEKVMDGQRLSVEDGRTLLKTSHGKFVEELADFDRERRAGNKVIFSSTLHLYPTNFCQLACPLCSFYATPESSRAWIHSPEQLLEKIIPFIDEIIEVHIVGGIWKACSLSYYEKLFRLLRGLSPTLHIKALTAEECFHLAKEAGVKIEDALCLLRDCGLGSLPGGGAEILVDKIRKTIAPRKLSSSSFLEIHRLAHSLGIPTNVTMLFGHIERDIDIVCHLDKVRNLQDIHQGICAFVPLKFFPENTQLSQIPIHPRDPRRIIAVSRLMLDNVRNIKALWNYLGYSTALELLRCGANDLGSTSIEEKVSLAAGGKQEKMSESTIRKAILSVGRIPHKIHSGHVAPINNGASEGRSL